MRTLFSRIACGAMIAAAALTVSACGKSTEANTTEDVNMTDLNTMDSSEGMTNDASAMDSMGNDSNMMMTDNAAEPAADANSANAM
jgi:hypothetical protein